MQTQHYLERVRRLTATRSDYAIAKLLGLSETSVSHYVHGRRIMDNFACLKVAQALNVPLQEVIAAAEYDRAKDEGTRDVWTRFLHAAGRRISRSRTARARA